MKQSDVDGFAESESWARHKQDSDNLGNIHCSYDSQTPWSSLLGRLTTLACGRLCSPSSTALPGLEGLLKSLVRDRLSCNLNICTMRSISVSAMASSPLDRPVISATWILWIGYWRVSISCSDLPPFTVWD